MTTLEQSGDTMRDYLGYKVDVLVDKRGTLLLLGFVLDYQPLPVNIDRC